MVDVRYIQHSKGDRDNVQLGVDATLFWPRYTAISGALFIDELRIATMFDSDKSRNWIAAQIGVRVEDVWGLVPRSTTLIEYTRLNPWVYEHASHALIRVRRYWCWLDTSHPLPTWALVQRDGLYGEFRYDVGNVIRFGISGVVRWDPSSGGSVTVYGARYRAIPFSGNVTTTWRSAADLVLLAAYCYRNYTV